MPFSKCFSHRNAEELHVRQGKGFVLSLCLLALEKQTKTPKASGLLWMCDLLVAALQTRLAAKKVIKKGEKKTNHKSIKEETKLCT